ncbi:hypothetical protein GCM10009715_10570 [Paeniglutamicibacter psychrophenolicus]|uniref:Phage tail sheath protein FI n=1 Tax=Paeniglutamicibacter psychrophenolicus TaxID=257454 RepID=A0ABS4WG19_9MICC|nr:phage tail sheath subtilisin-like domain-containing protein [Paeniglutamicibacter psychrophenolicus]MBP2375157.1 phage tail sheath protein FI [Paeniglutamicibacter psychrophenolicus]
MPEYLAPGVYVEEVPSTNKPIQGASTSTAGMVGLTDRGPVGVPTLVTSLASYARGFGGKLDPANHPPGYATLPFAAEGFFANGGSRLYVVRVVGGAATSSWSALYAPEPGGPGTVLLAPSATGRTEVVPASNTGFAADDIVLVGGATANELAVVALPDAGARHVLAGALRWTYPVAAAVQTQVATALAGTLSAQAFPGAATLGITDPTGISEGEDLLLQAPAGGTGAEFIRVLGVQSVGEGAEQTHTLLLQWPLAGAFEAGSTLSALAASADPATTLVTRAAAGMAPGVLELDDAAAAAAGAIVRLTGDGRTEIALVDSVPTAMSLAEPLKSTHASGSALGALSPVLEVHARWPGEWGDSLRLTVSPAALATTELAQELRVDQSVMQVDNALGLYPGSVLVLGDLAPGAAHEVLVVQSVDRDAGSVTLRDPAAQLHPVGTAVASREFTLLVELVENDRAVQSERFANLSLDPLHPRYAPGQIGSWDGGTPSEAGGSELIRLAPVTGDPPAGTLVADLPRYLSGGSADAASITEADFKGRAAVDPGLRTGIQALENESTLSIVAVPGITSLVVQQALVAHCAKMRYRFAVLDVPAGSSMNGALAHRQNFDSTRAAIYYPYLCVSNPFGTAGETLELAPSGHLLGVYARTDNTRGVHKAPANEVLLNVLSLRVALTKGEQDILNPINLNALRDFRSENRGIRVYGGRVATSDPEWKYINVRRLALFIEQSVDTGLQWAVFEPNDKPLWDAVRQSVTGFLDTVWRSGALQGTKASEAFFVNIGYNVTMSQADIDNGMLVIEVGFAPVKPAEFVIFRLSQKTIEATA